MLTDACAWPSPDASEYTDSTTDGRCTAEQNRHLYLAGRIRLSRADPPLRLRAGRHTSGTNPGDRAQGASDPGEKRHPICAHLPPPESSDPPSEFAATHRIVAWLRCLYSLGGGPPPSTRAAGGAGVVSFQYRTTGSCCRAHDPVRRGGNGRWVLTFHRAHRRAAR
jgi:hypothetical protein